MYILNWQPPYDWSWMLGFLAARAVSGVETVADSYYARSLAVGEYRGVVTAIPDIARHTLHINLSAGLEPVAAECLAKMSRLLDLQCNPQIVNGALGKLGAARPGLRLPGSVDAFEQGVRAILGQLVSVAMAAKLTARVAQLYGERLDDFPEYIFPHASAAGSSRPAGIKSVRYAVETGRGADSSGKCGAGGHLTNDNTGRCGAGDENAANFSGYRALDGELFRLARLAGERCFSAG